MAKIEFTAFVEDVKDWMVKTSEPHRKQIDGEWKTVSRTYRIVKSAYGQEIDFRQFSVGDRVEVVGTESTVVREFEGKKFYDLTVKAETISRITPKQGFAQAASEPDWDAPF